jgi:hypothetical protein
MTADPEGDGAGWVRGGAADDRDGEGDGDGDADALGLGVGAGVNGIDGKGCGDVVATGLVEDSGAGPEPAGPEPPEPAVGRACDDREPGSVVGDPPTTASSAGRPESRCSTWMDTAESARKAIAPADITMTGTVLPAGCERTSVPTCPTVVRTRSTISASASCGTGSGGQ